MKALQSPRRWETFVWPFLLAVALLLIWHVSVHASGTKIFPSPKEVALGIRELLQKNVLWLDIADSLRRVVEGFGLAVVIGVPFGILLGWNPSVHETFNPLIQVLRPISPIAWIPITILIVGVGDHAATSLIFLGSLFPIVVSCAAAVGSTSKTFTQVGQNFGLTQIQILRQIVFPASLPQILNGLRTALGIAWLVVVAAEMVAVDSGLGYLIIDSRNSGKRYDLVIAAMLLIGAIGLVLDWLFSQVRYVSSVSWGFRNDS